MSVNGDVMVAVHESGHAVVARLVGLQVVHAAAGEEAGVRTRFRNGTTAAQAMATAEKLALIDLAGAAAERRRLREAWHTHEQNAAARALRIVLLRRGLEEGAEVTAALRTEAAELVERLRDRVAQLVEENWAAIERVAGALAGGEPSTQSGIDVLIADQRREYSTGPARPFQASDVHSTRRCKPTG